MPLLGCKVLLEKCDSNTNIFKLLFFHAKYLLSRWERFFYTAILESILNRRTLETPCKSTIPPPLLWNFLSLWPHSYPSSNSLHGGVWTFSGTIYFHSKIGAPLLSSAPLISFSLNSNLPISIKRSWREVLLQADSDICLILLLTL